MSHLEAHADFQSFCTVMGIKTRNYTVHRIEPLYLIALDDTLYLR